MRKRRVVGSFTEGNTVERAIKTEIDIERNKKEWASSVGLCLWHQPQHSYRVKVSPWGRMGSTRNRHARATLKNGINYWEKLKGNAVINWRQQQQSVGNYSVLNSWTKKCWKDCAKKRNSGSNFYSQAGRCRAEVAFSTGHGPVLHRWNGTTGRNRVPRAFSHRPENKIDVDPIESLLLGKLPGFVTLT